MSDDETVEGEEGEDEHVTAVLRVMCIEFSRLLVLQLPPVREEGEEGAVVTIEATGAVVPPVATVESVMGESFD